VRRKEKNFANGASKKKEGPEESGNSEKRPPPPPPPAWLSPKSSQECTKTGHNNTKPAGSGRRRDLANGGMRLIAENLGKKKGARGVIISHAFRGNTKKHGSKRLDFLPNEWGKGVQDGRNRETREKKKGNGGFGGDTEILTVWKEKKTAGRRGGKGRLSARGKKVGLGQMGNRRGSLRWGKGVCSREKGGF